MKRQDNTYLVGRLVADPEKKTPNGKELADFTVAVDREFGEKKTAVYYRCTVWGKASETIMRLCKKGDWIAVDGQINASAYIAKDGAPRATLNLTVDNFIVMKYKTEAMTPVEDPDNPF